MSASTSIQLFLSALIVTLVLGPILTLAAWQRWTAHQKQQRQQAFLEQARAYALLTNPLSYLPEQMNCPQTNSNQDWTVIQ